MAPQRDGDLTSGLLIAFDDGIGGCEDGAAQLLSSIVADASRHTSGEMLGSVQRDQRLVGAREGGDDNLASSD